MAQRTRLLNSLQILILFAAVTGAAAQNTVNLYLEDGAPFIVMQNAQTVTSQPQANVSLPDVTMDTLMLRIQLETGTKYEVTLFLLEKGRKTTGKEFNYMLRKQKHRLQPVFMGMRAR